MHAAADSGCNENAHLMCERSNHGLCWLQLKSWHCGGARVMDVLLGLLHCWRWSGEPHIPVCPSVGRNLGDLSAEISHNKTSGQSSRRRSLRLAVARISWGLAISRQHQGSQASVYSSGPL